MKLKSLLLIHASLFYHASCASEKKIQLAVVFSRLANEGYEEALIAQGALPILLSMLTLSDLTHVEYCHRIRYKAALCLATIASKGFGLKAIYQNNGEFQYWVLFE